jgi:hypothetical protein
MTLEQRIELLLQSYYGDNPINPIVAQMIYELMIEEGELG